MLHILSGDITQAPVDAIVNAANPAMLGGGGVDGAIHKAAGPKLLAACRQIKAVNGVRCPFGEARITTAGDLPATYVIHTVGPIYHQSDAPEETLKKAYRNSLQLALQHNCQSIALPAISCGSYGYPHRQAATIALQICQQRDYQALDIQFYLFGSTMYALWQHVLNTLPQA